jgi:uncharacterized protein (TIGR00369 family)
MTDDRTPLKFALDIPFVETLGMQLWRFDGGFAEISLEVRPEMQNSWAVAHGGVVMPRLAGVRPPAAPGARDDADHAAPGIVTVEMKTSFLRPATGRLMATGHLLHGTKGMAFCEGSVHDASGALCAHATGTFKFMRELKRGAEIS